MPYVKPQLLCQDMPLTFQMVNLTQENLYEGWLQFAKWHGTAETGAGYGGITTPAPPGQRFGAHNDKRIPRAVVRVENLVVSVGSTPGVPFVVGGGGEAGVIGPATRQGVGVLDVEVYLRDVHADCTPFSDALASPQRFIIPTFIAAVSGSVLRFESYELVSGSFVRSDFDFTAHVYGSV
jgi:hypothetical protein